MGRAVAVSEVSLPIAPCQTESLSHAAWDNRALPRCSFGFTHSDRLQVFVDKDFL
jgi:hypothetical protein